MMGREAGVRVQTPGLSPCDGSGAGVCALVRGELSGSLASARLGGRGRKRVLALPTRAGGFCGRLGAGREGSTESPPPPRPGCLLTDETVTVLKQFGQKDFKL